MILLVTHGATVIALARSLLGNQNLLLRVGSCSISEFVRKEGEGWKVVGRWEVKNLVDGTRLNDGALKDWGFEDVKRGENRDGFSLSLYIDHASRSSKTGAKEISRKKTNL